LGYSFLMLISQPPRRYGLTFTLIAHSRGDGARLWLSQSSRTSERTRHRRPIFVTPGSSPREIIV
jgi:hypothetical protein